MERPWEHVKIKYFDPVCKLEKINVGDWIDLKSSVDIDINPGEYAAIPLGVAMQLPEGYEAWVVSRSSLFKRHGIIQANSIAIIDNSFCGDSDEWSFLAYNPTKEIAKIEKGERICQMRIMKNMPDIVFENVETLGNPNRGRTGSTGKM